MNNVTPKRISRFTIEQELACSVPLYHEQYDGGPITVSHTMHGNGFVDIHFDGPSELLWEAISDCGFDSEDLGDGISIVEAR